MLWGTLNLQMSDSCGGSDESWGWGDYGDGERSLWLGCPRRKIAGAPWVFLGDKNQFLACFEDSKSEILRRVDRRNNLDTLGFYDLKSSGITIAVFHQALVSSLNLSDLFVYGNEAVKSSQICFSLPQLKPMYSTPSATSVSTSATPIPTPQGSAVQRSSAQRSSAQRSLILGAIAGLMTWGAADAAQAFSFRVTSGINGPNGETNQGAFSEFYGLKNTRNVDFNNGSAPSTGFAQYSFGGSSSSVRKNMWAPVGPKGEQNTSSYLAAFSGSNVTIKLQETLNYFGINWGAAHGGNTYTFYKGDQLVKSFQTSDIEAAGGFHIYSALHPGSGQGAKDGKQGNGYVHFYADQDNETFDKIVISQVGGGGFETDNHSFHIGSKAFNWNNPEKTPEPGMILGAIAVTGGIVFRRRRVLGV